LACGGDGSLHEIINGMFHRSDVKKVPIAYFPNGTGNMAGSNLYIDSIERALDYLIKGDVIKMDIQRILFDNEKVEDMSKEERV
jgi:diacylglycerol kinase family enzyme